MSDLITFHNDAEIKAKYVARVERHIQADELVRGIGWDNSKGCAVGCTLEAYEHARYEIELGIPEWLARLEDALFEGMGVEKSRAWPKVFLEAMPVGVSADRLEREVKGPLMVYMLEGVKATFDNAKFPAVLNAIDGSIALWMRDDIRSKDWQRAAETARRAALAAEAEAEARAAAWAARTAVRAAEAWASAAARAARAAWTAAAAAEVYDRYADELIRLLANLTVTA